MPSGLRRYQHARQLHYVTFTCYHRAPHLSTPLARNLLEQTLERVRHWYGFCISGYVVKPEHVHLLVSEPEHGELCVVLQMLKQIVSRKLGTPTEEPFWQRRYYDFNVWSRAKFGEKLDYMHNHPGAPSTRTALATASCRGQILRTQEPRAKDGTSILRGCHSE